MKITRNKGIVAMLAAMAVLSAASLALACTGQTRILSITPQAGPPGTAVTLKGEAIVPGTPVEVRWNGLNGPGLANATAGPGGTFSAVVNVPEAAPGVYYLVVSAGETAVARNAFEVTASASVPGGPVSTANVPGRSVSSGLWNGLSANRGAVDAGTVAGTPSRTQSPGALIGIALAGAGAVAMSGVALTVSRRRRETGGEAH